MDDYLGGNSPDPAALYIVWGGGNDLFDDDSAASVTAAANNVAELVKQLARAGARTFSCLTFRRSASFRITKTIPKRPRP